MLILKTKNFKFLTTIFSVLVAFLLLRSYQLAYVVLTGSESSFSTAVRGIAIVPYFGLSYLAHKKNMLAAWGMVIVLGMAGASSLIFGIVIVPLSQYILKIFSVISGAYFAYGSSILYRSIRNGEMNPISQNKKKA